MVLEQGRPQSNEGRETKEIRTYDLLDSLGISYERVDHPPAMTMEVCEAIDAVLQAQICKNLFLCNRQKTAFYLLMIPGNKKFKTKDLSGQIGSARLSFAGAEEMQQYLQVTPGSVSVMGLMHDTTNAVRLLVDADVLQEPYVGCHPCVNTSSLRIRREDLFEKVVPAMHHTVTVVHLMESVDE